MAEFVQRNLTVICGHCRAGHCAGGWGCAVAGIETGDAVIQRCDCGCKKVTIL